MGILDSYLHGFPLWAKQLLLDIEDIRELGAGWVTLRTSNIE